MRLFYAVLFSREAGAALERIQETLKGEGLRGRYIPPANFHLTLHFLGETPPEEVPGLGALLEREAGGIRLSPLEFSGLGSFPRGGRDLVYARFSDPGRQLAELSSRLGRESGRGDRRSLKPHITLIRDGRIPPEDRRELPERRFPFPPAHPVSLALMESRQGRGGVEYLPLFTMTLPEK